jgi:hypothetical protein
LQAAEYPKGHQGGIFAGELPDTVKVVIRLPPALHAALVRLAARDLRSLNGEMLFFLRREVIIEGEDPDHEPDVAHEE